MRRWCRRALPFRSRFPETSGRRANRTGDRRHARRRGSVGRRPPWNPGRARSAHATGGHGFPGGSSSMGGPAHVSVAFGDYYSLIPLLFLQEGDEQMLGISRKGEMVMKIEECGGRVGIRERHREDVRGGRERRFLAWLASSWPSRPNHSHQRLAGSFSTRPDLIFAYHGRRISPRQVADWIFPSLTWHNPFLIFFLSLSSLLCVCLPF